MTKHILIGMAFCLSFSVLGAESKKVCNPTVQASVVAKKEITDEGQFLVAEVKNNGKPLKNISVSFQTQRLFGVLSHGEALTDDSGIAKISFPENFPGEAKSGDFSVTAKIVKSETYLGEASIRTPGGISLKEVVDPFPREIWSTKTDLHLLFTIPVLIFCVWSIYVFSLMQLFKIVRLGK